MRRLILISLLASVSALAFPAESAESNYINFIQGTCADYVRAEPMQRALKNGHMFGYITAANRFRKRMSPVNANSYVVWIEEYCKQNPFELYADALDKLDKSLGEGIYKKQ